MAFQSSTPTASPTPEKKNVLAAVYSPNGEEEKKIKKGAKKGLL